MSDSHSVSLRSVMGGEQDRLQRSRQRQARESPWSEPPPCTRERIRAQALSGRDHRASFPAGPRPECPGHSRRYRRRGRSNRISSDYPRDGAPGSHEPGCDALLWKPKASSTDRPGISACRLPRNIDNWPTIKQGDFSAVTDFYSASSIGKKHRPHPEERALARVSKDGRESCAAILRDACFASSSG
jgi:hypothetical protein